ncbi:MAG: acetoin utilization protein AcuC [Dehalococcoidia bacterium]|nr:acetoin utilization protein AcuC [Dehalococcoidia bacterium]
MVPTIVYSDEIRGYDFGPGHPFRSDRYANFMRLLRSSLDAHREIEPRCASDEELMLVHDKAYIDALLAASDGAWLRSSSFMSPDTPLQPGMERAARFIVGASMTAAEVVWKSDTPHAVGVGGGLHHARRSYAAGFCIYNDVAVCALNLLQNHGAERILILDTDAHAGDGTCHIFYRDPRVLFIDLHQDPHTLYPGTGFAYEIGEDKGRGFTVNVPMPPGASDQAYEYALDHIFAPLAEEFHPQIIIRNGGSDPHFADELTDLGLTLEGFRMVGEKVRQVAERVCEGRRVDLLGSGYNQTVLPPAWLALVAGSAGLDIKLKEAFRLPISTDSGLDETRRVVEEVKKNLRGHWRCLRM